MNKRFVLCLIVLLLLPAADLFARDKARILFRGVATSLSLGDREEIAKALELPLAKSGKSFVDDLGKEVEIQVREIDLRGPSDKGILLFLENPYLYGIEGCGIILFAKNASGSYCKFIDIPGSDVYVSQKTTNGYPDLRIIQRGNSKTVWSWNGKEYAPRDRDERGTAATPGDAGVACDVIDTDRVGALSLNRSYKDFVQPPLSCARETRKEYCEGEGLVPVEYLIVKNGEKSLLEFTLDDSRSNIPDEAYAISTAYKTMEGITVGSTILDVVRAYPRCQFWYTYVSKTFVAEVPSMDRVQFILDPKGYIDRGLNLESSDKVDLHLSNFQPHTAITRVRVYRFPDNSN